jgi:hypothetical protein
MRYILISWNGVGQARYLNLAEMPENSREMIDEDSSWAKSCNEGGYLGIEPTTAQFSNIQLQRLRKSTPRTSQGEEVYRATGNMAQCPYISVKSVDRFMLNVQV